MCVLFPLWHRCIPTRSLAIGSTGKAKNVIFLSQLYLRRFVVLAFKRLTMEQSRSRDRRCPAYRAADRRTARRGGLCGGHPLPPARPRRPQDDCGARSASAGGEGRCRPADLADCSAVGASCRRPVRTLGPLTLLVNNASSSSPTRSRRSRRSGGTGTSPSPAPAFLARDFAASAPGRQAGRLHRQHRRSAGLEADAAILFLHADQGRPVRDADHGPGAGAADPRQCHGPGPTLSNDAPGRWRISPSRAARYCSAMAVRRTRSPMAVLYLARARSVTAR